MEDWRFKPAADLGLTPAQRLRSLQREAGLPGAIGQALWWNAMRLYAAAVHRVRVEGREHLPAEPPFVLVANHASHLDTIVLMTSLTRAQSRRAFPLAAGDTFFDAGLSAAFAAGALNALPVWRSRTRRQEIDALRARLADDRCIFILFPEGTRTRSGEMGAFKPGLGALVAGSEIPVVPAYLDGCWRALPPQRKLPRPLPIAVRFGPALRFADRANDKDGWHAVAAASEAAVRTLGGLAPRGPAPPAAS
ncbi:MAG: 1-acyl-sn-glycerol-3-phosphate acyltransferase [Alphaproteobacteria bacterium]|nr:1-acyl-sn-glycerol-3-phosphate acyltransferase [Alphaproteobacteria bacterium]